MSMPQVTLSAFDQREQVVEFPEDAIILHVKEWVHEKGVGACEGVGA